MQITIKHGPEETALARKIAAAVELAFPHLPFKETKQLSDGRQQIYYRFSFTPKSN